MEFNNFNFVVQAFVAAILIGVIYNLIATTRSYGGIIGKAIRWIGVGILFISVAIIEKVLMNFEIMQVDTNGLLAQDILFFLSLSCLAMGFYYLRSATRV